MRTKQYRRGADNLCRWCQTPIPASRRLGFRSCSRACTLAALGLPPDFDPAVLDVAVVGHGRGNGKPGHVAYDYVLQPDTPAIEATIRALLDAAVPALRDEVPIAAQGPAARQQMRRRA